MTEAGKAWLVAIALWIAFFFVFTTGAGAYITGSAAILATFAALGHGG